MGQLSASATISSEEARRIYPNVRLGKNVVIEDYCVIGYPPKGCQPGELETVIGDHTLIRTHSVIYAGCVIGQECHISHLVTMREHTTVGDHCSIGGNAYIEHHCRIGNRVRIQAQAGLCEYTIVEDNAWIGPRVITTNVMHPTCEHAKDCLAGPIIREGAIIGAAVAIAPDTEIGRNAFLSLGAVVYKSVPDDAIMLGNPARKVSTIHKIDCPYELMNGKSPYPKTPAAPEREIPLVDLAAQHQRLKMELRLAIDTVILNTRFIQGKEVREFEADFAAFCGVEQAVGVGSGTDALILALRGLGIGPGDEVLTTPHTFIATVEAILAVGAVPVFVDIDPATYLIDVGKMAAKITPRTKAVLPVHLYGQSAPMPEILALAERYGLKVVADAAQAHGAELDGRPIAQWGHATCFSFYPGKNLGAYGDAGLVATRDADLAGTIRMLRDHGRKEKYEHAIVGTNSRLDTVQAAVLKTKLPHLSDWNALRRQWAERYRQGLQHLPVTLPVPMPQAKHVYHLYVIQLPERGRLQSHLKQNGIATGIHYPIPLHLQPSLRFLGYHPGDFPVTEEVAGRILSLPMYPELTEQQVDHVIAGLCEFFRGA